MLRLKDQMAGIICVSPCSEEEGTHSFAARSGSGTLAALQSLGQLDLLNRANRVMGVFLLASASSLPSSLDFVVLKKKTIRKEFR